MLEEDDMKKQNFHLLKLGTIGTSKAILKIDAYVYY